jgi:hypothetical protein
MRLRLLAVLTVAFACSPSMEEVRPAPRVFAQRQALHHRHVCGDAMPGYARCLSLVRCNARGRIQPFTSPAGYGPAELASAYHLPPGGGAGQTIAIVDAMDAPNIEADLAVYRAHFGLPACTTANGCFKKVSQTGSTTALPAPDDGWAEEITLDVDMASAICPSCKILLVEATSPTTANLGAAVNEAVRLGANVVSNSYGGDESATDPSTTVAFYDHPGVLITASSGDDGFGVNYPAAAPNVLAVGGTTLARTSTARGWTESAWGSASNANGGAGSGCSSLEAKPPWQHDTGCSRRTVADVSAVADPNTGVSVYVSTAGGWLVFGGTSVAAPVVAAIFALTGHAAETSQYPYANSSQFYDVASGVNGTCNPSYLCTGIAGYDGPTGIGTPNGTAMISGVAPAAVARRSAADFSLSAPASLSLPAGTTAIVTLKTATVAGAPQTVTLGNFEPPPGVTVAISPARLTSGGSATVRISATSAAARGPLKLVFTGTTASGVHLTNLTLLPD